jgi:hypothetical protein
MKTRIILAISMVALLSSCSYHSHSYKPLPPGQAKKLTGSKSAKPYAPGQQKKKH